MIRAVFICGYHDHHPATELELAMTIERLPTVPPIYDPKKRYHAVHLAKTAARGWQLNLQEEGETAWHVHYITDETAQWFIGELRHVEPKKIKQKRGREPLSSERPRRDREELPHSLFNKAQRFREMKE